MALNFPSPPTLNQIFTDGSSWMWDGAKWLDTSNPLPLLVLTPASGAMITLTDRRPVWIDNAAVLASLTIRLPASPAANDLITIGFLSPVTSLSMQNSAGVVLPTGPTNAYGPGSALYFRYINATRGWVNWK